MKWRQAFKFELEPNGAQMRDMRRFAGCCRFVFNKALALQQSHHQSGEKFIGYYALAKQLTEWRNRAETPWLKDAPVHPLQHALKDLERAYQNFFARRAGLPRFRRKGSGERFRYPDAKQFEIEQSNSRIKLPKLGWMRYRNSRDILGTAKNITIRLSGGTCYASTEREVQPPCPTSSRAVGIDVGIARFATLSDGSFIAPLSSFKKHQRWAEFRRQLEYKTQWAGGMLLAVPAHHTSQSCPRCRHVAPANRRTQAKFLCVVCGYGAHADEVGAFNVLERGLALVSLWRGGLWPGSQDPDATSLCEAGTHRSDPAGAYSCRAR